MKAAIRKRNSIKRMGKKGKTSNQDNLAFLSGRKLIREAKYIKEC